MARSSPARRPSSKATRRKSSKAPRRQTRSPADNNSIGNIKKSHERYLTLARAAEAAGDAVGIENLYQHAEHYFRLLHARAAAEKAV